MTIIVKSISKKYGRDQSVDYDDFNNIIKSPLFGGSNGIKDIRIRNIEIQSGGAAIDVLQFTYEVITNAGESYFHVGMKYGSNGGSIYQLNINVNEQVTGITGKYGGEVDAVGVFFGSGGAYVNSLGTYEIETVIKPTVTVTSDQIVTVTSIPSPCSQISPQVTPVSQCLSSSSFAVLSSATGILGFYFLLTMGIYLLRKFYYSKAVPTPGNQI